MGKRHLRVRTSASRIAARHAAPPARPVLEARKTRRLRGARAAGVEACRRKFLRYFPGGFADQTYLDWERDYKWTAHERWSESLGRPRMRALLRRGGHREIADLATRIEARTNLLFSFEKIAVRDAVRSPAGARRFAAGLYELLHGTGGLERRFERWCDAVEGLPRAQTRVLTWPSVTVFGFLAQPEVHVFLKPVVTRIAAGELGYELDYRPRPNWTTYASLLDLADRVRRDLRDLRPRDQIDVQSFLWVQGSDEYP
jgi:hypothetical protein